MLLLNSKKNINEQEINNVLRKRNKQQMCDSEAQVYTFKIHTSNDLFKTDTVFKSFKGSDNLYMLDYLVKMVNKVIQDKRLHKITILTMTHIKLVLSYAILGILSNVSIQFCKT